MKFPTTNYFLAAARLAKRAGVALACFALLSLSACDDDDDPTDSTMDQLNSELLSLLKAASPTSSIDYFMMPSATDFASIPQDPNNPLTTAKVALGQLLYHETAILTNPKKPEGLGTSSCASCHHAESGFQAGLPQGIGEGGWGAFGDRMPNPDYQTLELDIQPIRSPTAMNAAWQEVMLWNGQFGATGLNEGTESSWTEGTPKFANHLGYTGLETQAIAGLAVHRLNLDFSIIENNATYKQMFEAAFPGADVDDEHIGLAIAAYERTLLSNKAPFQKWLAGDRNALSEQELRGAIAFFGSKANCNSCHTGPALSSMTFYALGMNDLAGEGVYGDGPDLTVKYGRGGFTGNSDDNYKFKTPSLYNLIDSRFYGHGASMHSVREVIEYKNAAVAENISVPESQLAAEFTQLNLSDSEMEDMTAFISTGLYDDDLLRYVPTSLPSGDCFPFSDAQAKLDMGCN